MNLNELKNMIDQKNQKEMDEAAVERIAIAARKSIGIMNIKALRPRIADLIELGNYAKDNGIKLEGHSWGGHEGYDTHQFCTNSWSHLVGFVLDKEITCLGIDNGGACGPIDFRTDGVDVWGENNKVSCPTRMIPCLEDIEYFLRKFDEFEESFINYIKEQCK